VASILTSLYPTQLGLVEIPVPQSDLLEWRERRGQISHELPDSARTWAEMLKDAGFVTGAFINQPALNFTNSFQQGFDDWYAPVAPGVIERCEPEQEFRPQEWSSTKFADESDWALTRKFDAWLEQHAAKPDLFAWVHLLTPHMPYRPAEKYAPVVSGEGDEPSNSELYDGEVRAIDDMIGDLLESIEKHVGLGRSLIVLTADHGEEFRDHGMFGHGHSLHQEVIRVPLIIASGSLPGGRIIDNHVRTTDILPTVLDVIGQSSAGPPDMEGTTLVPLVAGHDSRLAVYSEAMLYGSTERAVMQGEYKLMCDEQEERCRLFGVLVDPDETSDVAHERPRQASSMRQRLNELHTRLAADYRRRRLKYINQGGLTEIEQQRALDALRALGYVGD
jgi:arylsulfatase A-like enzyme